MRLTPGAGPKCGLPGLVLVQILVQSLPVPCLAFSRGASGSSCARMVPGHVHAHPHDPALSHVTLHTSSTHYLPGHLLTVTVRSSRDFMGFLLQARRVQRPGASPQSQIHGQVRVTPSGVGSGGILLGGSWTLTPPGTHTIRCVSDDDTVTHSDKQLKRNLSFVWRAPDRPMGDVRFYITVVQSYFVYWTGIPSPVLHDGIRNHWRGNSMMQVQTFDEDTIQDEEEEMTNAINATTKRLAVINVTTPKRNTTSRTRFWTQNKTTPPDFLLNNTGISTANVKTKANDNYGTNDGVIGTFVRSESLLKDKATQANTEDSNKLASTYSPVSESTIFSNATKDSEANMLPMANATRPSSLLTNDKQKGGINAKILDVNNVTHDSTIRYEDFQTTLPRNYTICNETEDNTMRQRVEMNGGSEQQKIDDVQKHKLDKSMTKTNTTLVQDSPTMSQSQQSPLDIHLEASKDKIPKLSHSTTQTPQTTSLNTILDTKTSTASSNFKTSSSNSGNLLHFSTTQDSNITKTKPTIALSATESGQDNLLLNQPTSSSTLSDVTPTAYLQDQTFVKPTFDALSEIEINPPTNRVPTEHLANRAELLVTPNSSPVKSIKSLLLHLDSLQAEEKTTIPKSIAETTLSIATTSEIPSNLMATSKVSQIFLNSKDLENMKLVDSTNISASSSATESNYSTSSLTKPTANSSLHPKWSSTSSPIPFSKWLYSALKYVISSKSLTNAATNSHEKSPNSPEDLTKHETSSPSTFYASEFHDKTTTSLSKNVSTSPPRNSFSNLSENSTDLHKSTMERPISMPTNKSTIITTTTSSNETRQTQNIPSSLNSESTKLFLTNSSTSYSTFFASLSRHDSIATSQDSRSPLPNNSIYNFNQNSTNSSKFTFTTSQSTVHSTHFASTSRDKAISSAQALRNNLLQTSTNFRLPISEHVTTSLPVLQNPTSPKKATTATSNVQPRSTTLSNGTPTPDSSKPSPLNSTFTHFSTDFPSGSNQQPSLFPFHTSTKPTHQYVQFPYGETSSVATKDTTLDAKYPIDFTSTISNDDIGLVYESKPASMTLSTKVTTNVPTSSIAISTTSDQHSSTTSNSLNSAKMSLRHKPTVQFPKREERRRNSSFGQNSSLESKDTMADHTKNHTFHNMTNSYSTFSTLPPESSNDVEALGLELKKSTSRSTTFTFSAVPKDSIVRTTPANFYKKIATSIKDNFIASRSQSIFNSTSQTQNNSSSISITTTSSASQLENHSSTIDATNTFQKTVLESIEIPTTNQASIHYLITGLTKKPRAYKASKPTTVGPTEQYNSSTKFTDASNTNEATTGPLADNLTTFTAISEQKQALEGTDDPTKESFSSFKSSISRILSNFSTVATNFHEKALLEMTTITSTIQSREELFSSKPSGGITTTSGTITKFHNKLVTGGNAGRPSTTDFQSSNAMSSISTSQFQSNSSTANYGQLSDIKDSTIGPKSQSSNHSSFYHLNSRSSLVSKGESKMPIDFSSLKTSDSKTSLSNEAKTTETTAQYSSKVNSSTVLTTLEGTTIAQTSPLTNQTLSSKNNRQTLSIASKSTINGRTTPKRATNFSQSLGYFLNTSTKSSSTIQSQSKNGLDGKNITPISSKANLHQATTIVPMREPALPTTLYQKSPITTNISPISVFVNSSTINSNTTFSRFSKMPTFVVTTQSQTPSQTSKRLSKSPTIASLMENRSTTNTKDNKRFTNTEKSSTFRHFPSISATFENKTLTVANFPYLPTPSPISSPPNESPFFAAQTYAQPKTTSSTSSYTIPNKSDSSPLKFKPSAARQSFLNHITTFKPTLAQKRLLDVALPNHSAKPNPEISRISQNTNQKPKVEVKAKLPPNIHPDRGWKYPDIVPRHSAWELGMLLGCSAGLGMVLVVGIRYVHRKACGKRTQVTLHDREREYSRGERGLIHVQECGDLVRVRRIRENSFVLLAEYDILATPGD